MFKLEVDGWQKMWPSASPLREWGCCRAGRLSLSTWDLLKLFFFDLPIGKVNNCILVCVRLVFMLKWTHGSEFWQKRWHRMDFKAAQKPLSTLWVPTYKLNVVEPFLSELLLHSVAVVLNQEATVWKRIISVKYLNSQINTSMMFSVLAYSLWAPLCSETVSTAALAGQHGESPELLYRASFFPPLK